MTSRIARPRTASSWEIFCCIVSSLILRQELLRRCFVFRMTLEEDDQTVQLLHEHVDARSIRPREHAIATRRQGVLRDIVPPGMRHWQSSRRAGRQGVSGDSQALEDAETLV